MKNISPALVAPPVSIIKVKPKGRVFVSVENRSGWGERGAAGLAGEINGLDFTQCLNFIACVDTDGETAVNAVFGDKVAKIRSG